MKPKTLFEKVWEQHEVAPETADTPAVLYIDLHLIHEVTTPQAFASCVRAAAGAASGPHARHLDHSTPTDPASVRPRADQSRIGGAPGQADGEELPRVRHRAAGLGSDQRGIVHVIGPELGATSRARPSCAATATPRRTARSARSPSASARPKSARARDAVPVAARPKTLAIEVERPAARRVTAKDVILAIIGKIGVAAARARSSSTAVGDRALSMEERMTICNMSIEAGARAGMIAPDETTFAYLEGRRCAPQGERGTGRRALAQLRATAARTSTASSRSTRASSSR
jgi:3-isopropylmalate/(R)-2-methylmalate dehydratase large subunit